MASYGSYFNDVKRSLAPAQAATIPNSYYNEVSSAASAGGTSDSGSMGSYGYRPTVEQQVMEQVANNPHQLHHDGITQIGTTNTAAPKGNSYTDQVNAIYDAALAQQKAQIEADAAGLDRYYQLARQRVDQDYQNNLNRTAVEADKANLNWNEVKNALGLSSGTMGQAWLARQNSTQDSMSDLRAAQQKAQADLEMEYLKRKDQYAAALREAIAQNDYERAKKLYELAVNGLTGTGANDSGSGSSSGRARVYARVGPQPAEAGVGGSSGSSGGRSKSGGKSSSDTEPDDDTLSDYEKYLARMAGNQTQNEAAYQTLADQMAGGDQTQDTYLAQIQKLYEAGRLSDARYNELIKQAMQSGR